jgi:hypothetical protein
VIPEPKHPIATLHEECRPSLIVLELRSMVAPIEINHEPMCRTTEIHDVRADGVLPAKLGVMELSVSQLPREYPLTVGLPSAKLSGKPTAPTPLTLSLSPSGGEGSLTPVPHQCYSHKILKNPILVGM